MSEAHQILASLLPAGHLRTVDGITHASPGTDQELAQVLRACTENRLTVTPTGGGTKLDWGNPVRPDVLLRLDRLSGVREHVWQDLTCTVAAGTPWGELQGALAQHRQRVALDPLFPRTATVGGIVATNDSGALRARFGSLRDLVLGATVVLADGTVARTGGKVVKNVAGYDLPKLMTGSFGTLAVVTEVTFRLHGLPAATNDWTLSTDRMEPLAGVLQSSLQSELSVEAVQLRTLPSGFALDLRLASIPQVVRGNETRLRELAQGCVLTPAPPDIWTERERLFDSPHRTVLKITALSSRLPALLSGFAELTRDGSLAARCVADPTGMLTVALDGTPDLLAAAVEDLRARLRGSGGMVVILRPGPLGETAERWGGAPAAVEVMRAIKREFDSNRTLNPGKFVGGI